MRRAAGILLLTILALPVGGLSAPSAEGGNCGVSGLPKTVRYRTIAGVAANANSLDVYSPPGASAAPVVLWVHGGGYHTGDKRGAASNKAALFNRKGWIFASINYRLTHVGDPGPAHFPDHYDDVATAVAWIKTNIRRYGGDPARVALLGHSAGADIVSNVADNPTYLKAHGLKLSALSCVGPLDTEGFDKMTATDTASEKLAWLDALGNNPKYRTATSATHLVKAGLGISRTIGVFRGTANRQKIEKAYLAKLRAAGVGTATIDARSLTHAEVSTQIGSPGDTVMTPPLVSFPSPVASPADATTDRKHAVELSLFDEVGDALRGLAPPELGEPHLRAHRYGVKVWFGPATPPREEHYEAQVVGPQADKRASVLAIEVGFHSEYAKAGENEAVIAHLLANEKKWRRSVGKEAQVGDFLGRAEHWRRVSETWPDPDLGDGTLVIELAMRLTDYITALEPVRRRRPK